MYITVKVPSKVDSEVNTVGLEVAPLDKIEKIKAQIHTLDQSLPPCKQLLIYINWTAIGGWSFVGGIWCGKASIYS